MIPEDAYCSRCKATAVPLIKYSRTKSGRQYFYCNPCNTARRRTWYQKGGKDVVAAVSKAYEQRNPARRPAWSAAQQLPLQPCERCGATGRIHRHHDDPLKKLDVIFLCPLHHAARHRELRQLTEAA